MFRAWNGAQPSVCPIERIRKLANDARYEAAFVFGSVAEGTSTDKSDLDVRVIVDDDNSSKTSTIELARFL